MIRVPGDLATTIATWAGDAGRAWLAALPRVVDDLAAEWELAVGEPYEPAGYASLAVRVTRDGEPLVLKVQYPDEWSEHEAAALRHYGGRAAVTIHAADPARRAVLLERCEPGTALLTEPDDVAARTVARLLTELWAPPAEGHPFRPLTGVLPRWRDEIVASARLDARLKDAAVEAIGWLASGGAADVVLHCDLHPGNVLRATRRPWLAIDPIPVVGDPAYDLAPVIRDRAAPDLVPRRFAIVTEVTGLDPARVRAWALLQTVEGAAWSYDAGDTKSGDAFVVAAECVAALRGDG